MGYYIGRVDPDGNITHCLINGLFVRFRGKVIREDPFSCTRICSSYFRFQHPKNYDFNIKNLRVFDIETNKDVTWDVVNLVDYRSILLKDIFPDTSDRIRRVLSHEISMDKKEKIYFLSDQPSFYYDQENIKREYDALNLKLPRGRNIKTLFNAIINSYQIKGIKKLSSKVNIFGMSIDSQDAYFELKLKMPFTFGKYYKIDRDILNYLHVKE